jgi:hypothetical protein
MKHLHFLLLVVVVGVASAAEVANMASSDLSNVSLEGTWKVSPGDLAPANAYLPDLDDRHPEYEGLARNIVQHWKFGRLARGGEMFGVYASDQREYRRQEGRLGYEQYSAAGFELWGVTYE